MPGHGPHHFEFIGKEPLIFRILVTLLAVVFILGFGFDLGAKYFLPRATGNLQACEALSSGGVQYHALPIICWFAGQWVLINFAILAAIAITMVVFRKRVRYTYRGRGR